MKLPTPQPGQVISYAYVWRDEAASGVEEGRKDRPCVIVLAAVTTDEATIVTVVPVTHAHPGNDDLAVELSVSTKARLGLDHERSWVVVNEINRFTWPGYDLRLTRRGADTCLFGVLPRVVYNAIRDGVVAAARANRLKITSRE